MKEEKKGQEKTKKGYLIAIIVVVAVVILGIVGVVAMQGTNSAITQDEYETMVEHTGSYSHYQFKFGDATEVSKEYDIKGNKLAFNVVSDGISSFVFRDKEKVETIAREYDVFYLNKAKSVLIVCYNDFSTDIYFANKDSISNLSEVLKGAYTFKNIAVENNVLKFEVERWSKDYVVTTDQNIFSVYFDNYKDYVEDDYPVELAYSYNLNNKDFQADKFEVTTIKTIKELYEAIKDLDLEQENELEEEIENAEEVPEGEELIEVIEEETEEGEETSEEGIEEVEEVQEEEETPEE